MSTYNICLYKKDKKFTGCNLKTTELLDSALLAVCEVIRSNMVSVGCPQMAKSVYPDEMLFSVASDLCLYCVFSGLYFQILEKISYSHMRKSTQYF